MVKVDNDLRVAGDSALAILSRWASLALFQGYLHVKLTGRLNSKHAREIVWLCFNLQPDGRCRSGMDKEVFGKGVI